MKDNKRILGIDYGTKRVGVAISDEAQEFALPMSVISNTENLTAEITKIASENMAREIVIGESRDYAGKPNSIFEDVEKFKTKLQKVGLIVYLEPEFMTSIQAERLQGKHDKTDASAAALILQSYLDKKKNKNS